MTLVETSVEITDNQNQLFESYSDPTVDLANLTPPTLIREEYSDDESIYTPKGLESGNDPTLDSIVCDSLDSEIEYESDTLSDLCESENKAYELYLQKILFEEESKRELLLEVFGENFDDSDYDN